MQALPKANYSDWRRGVLDMVGAKATPANLKFLSNWQRWEGGHTKNNARYNWLNTTMNAPGATGAINSVGVKSFSDKNAGINAMAMTLLNGRYNDIVSALRAGNPYKHDVSKGLQVWVSGKPDGNPGYAQKVLGGSGAPKAALPQGGRGPKGNPGLASPPSGDVWSDIFKYDKGFLKILDMFGAPKAPPGPPAGQAPRGAPVSYSGKTLVLPTEWKSTHPTDGLEKEGFRSATDIMGNPGTPVGAPEAGKIVRWGSAQGGSSIWFQGASGRMYWIGHIDNIAKPGTRVKRGQVIATISADHPRPHVHLDRRG